MASVSALLVVSLFLGASLNASRPALAASGEEFAGQRVAVRQLSATLAKAVRNLVGSDQHKPCVQTVAGAFRLPKALALIHSLPALAPAPTVALLRSALLDLPPPGPNGHA